MNDPTTIGEVPEAAVEAAAKIPWDAEHDAPRWDDLDQSSKGESMAWARLQLEAAAPFLTESLQRELEEARKQMRRASERLEGIVCEQINAPLSLAKKHRAMFDETGRIAVELRAGQVHYDDEWDQLEQRAEAAEGKLAEAEAEEKRQRKEMWDGQEARIREYAEANTSQRHRIRELEGKLKELRTGVQQEIDRTRELLPLAAGDFRESLEARIERLEALLGEGSRSKSGISDAPGNSVAAPPKESTPDRGKIDAPPLAALLDQPPEEPECETCGGSKRLQHKTEAVWMPCPDCQSPAPKDSPTDSPERRDDGYDPAKDGHWEGIAAEEDPRLKRVEEAIAAHMTTDEELLPDFYLEVARDVLRAADAQSFPPSHFAHRFKEPEPNALISQPVEEGDQVSDDETERRNVCALAAGQLREWADESDDTFAFYARTFADDFDRLNSATHDPEEGL